MADYIERYVRHLQRLGRAQATIDTYAVILRRADRDLPEGLAHAHAEEITEWIHRPRRRRREDAKPSSATIALYLAAVTGFFRRATDPRDPWLDFDLTRYLPDRPKVPRGTPRPLTVTQVADILARTPDPLHTWYLLARYAGLRCCEIAALNRDHVAAPPGDIWVHGKGGAERLVPTEPRIWAAVKDLPPGPVARRRDGTRASRRYVEGRGNRWLHERLELPDVTMHRFRHTAGTEWLADCGNLRVVQELLGHTSPATTALYTAVSDAQKRAAVMGRSAGAGDAAA